MNYSLIGRLRLPISFGGLVMEKAIIEIIDDGNDVVTKIEGNVKPYTLLGVLTALINRISNDINRNSHGA